MALFTLFPRRLDDICQHASTRQIAVTIHAPNGATAQYVAALAYLRLVPRDQTTSHADNA